MNTARCKAYSTTSYWSRLPLNSRCCFYFKTTAAVEVVMFIIARKMVSPTISALDLLLGAAALAGLIIVRFYYLPGEAK